MKIDYQYPAKHRMRHLITQGIRTWVPHLRDARVVCFPGAQALEIFEVYDVLKIPRSNITGIERDDCVFAQLEELKLGINLFHGEASDFFSKPEEFDVVSLDYTQLPSLETIRIVRRLFNERRFARKSFLYTNFYSSRINDFTKYNLPYVFSHELVSKGPRKKRLRGTFTSTHFWPTAQNALNIPLRTFRSDGLTHLLLLCLREDSFLDAMLAQPEVLPVKRVLEIISGDYKTFTKTVLPVADCHEVGNGRFSCSQQAMGELLRASFNQDVSTGKPLHLEYAIPMLQRFEYVSDDGSLMYSDFLFLERGDEHIAAYKSAVAGFCKHGHLMPAGSTNAERIRNKKILEKHANDWAQKTRMYDLFLKRLPPRVDVTPNKISKNEALSLLRQGKSPQCIAQNYQGFSQGQLAAFRAHITMGTYDTVPETVREVPQLSDKKSPSQPLPSIFSRGVVLYDSDGNRLHKNSERIVSLVPFESVRLYKSHDQMKGLDWYVKKRKGLYLLNSFDSQCLPATSLICERALSSRFFYRIYFIGSPSEPVSQEVEAAKALGAKIQVGFYQTNSPFLDPQRPLYLEQIVLG